MSGQPIINSGTITSPSGFTPSGNPMMVAVDNPYITKDDFIATFEAQGLGIDVNTPAYGNGTLDQTILDASAMVNRYCRRWFDSQTIDETKTQFSVRPFNPQLTTVVLNNRPFNSINTIYIQVLQWFIQVDTTLSGYLQIFPDKGVYKIVPLLSTAGTGAGSPIPAAILDRQPLGVLWTNYTFGYGTPVTGVTMTALEGVSKAYQCLNKYRLWAPSQTLNVYANAVLVDPSKYDVDYPNGIVTFHSDYAETVPITADFTTNKSIPADIRRATILYVLHLIGQALQNPTGAKSLGLQTFNITFGDMSMVEDRANKILEPYVDKRLVIL